MKKRARLGVVEWIDSSVQNGQIDRDDYPKPEVICSAGWLVEETPEYVTLARDEMTKENPGDYRGLVCIPRESIRQFFQGVELVTSDEFVVDVQDIVA